MRYRIHIRAAIFATALNGLLNVSAGSAEPLRILVPPFYGETVISKVISMTVYFEMVKAFRGPNTAERGAWILYGIDALHDASHRSATDAALWPSVSADVVIWGKVSRFGDGFVVEPYLTRTPISRERKSQPETLAARFSTPQREYDLSLANSAAFFDLEPFIVGSTIVKNYGDYIDGIPIYATESTGLPTAHTNDVIYFVEIKENVARVRYNERSEGWIRFPKLPEENLSMIYFGRGMIQILRGDWQQAVESFSYLIGFSTLPNALRVSANIYLGIADYKLGQSGLLEFRRAYALNGFDKDAARFMMLGLLLDYRQFRDPALLTELYQPS
jgi:hypothetical protein